MDIALAKTPAENAYLEAFAQAPDWLSGERKAAFEEFASTGLPHRRVEEWKWTDLRQILKQPFPPTKGGPTSEAEINRLLAASVGDVARARLVFVDGAYNEALSRLPASGDVSISPLNNSSTVSRRHDDIIDSLNIAYVSAGMVIDVAAGSTADAPIEVVCLATGAEPATISTRLVVNVGQDASAFIIETHIGGEGAYVANSVCEVHLGDKARLDRAKLQLEGANGVHLSSLIANLGTAARFNDFTLQKGAQTTRQNGFITFNGEHAEASVSGAFLQRNTQHCDTALVVDHAVPNCISRELFKCVMDDDARGIFQGKVIVRPDAQKTDGKQSSHALLLSNRAEFDAKPELEIYADDVVCGHGATSGELEEDYLFYLRARGIPEAQAKSMLIAAFAAEAFDQVENEALRGVLTEIAENWLVERA